MPLTEALWRPVLAVLLAAALPQLTARLLAWIYLRDLPPGGDERARLLQPFRRAALLTGLGQLQLAWMVGVGALGPRLAPHPSAPRALAFGAACALVAFLSGGLARRIERPPSQRATAWGVIRLRLRVVPWLLGPVAIGIGAASLPVVHGQGEQARLAWGWIGLALLTCGLGVAYGGLLASLVTTALRPAGAALRELAREVAHAEGARLALVLRLPTPGVRFANAAAIPWARTMVIADDTVDLLREEQLRAVLAHEAAHLSERPVVGLTRVGAATLILFSLTVGGRLAAPFGTWASVAALVGSVILAVALFLTVRRLARRMEERADAHAEANVGAVPLAEALRKLHAYAQMPMSTGRKRIHPDLHDRLHALGVDLGPRPPPPPKGGTRLGLLLAVALVGLPLAVHQLTDVMPERAASTPAAAAHARLFVEPWDGEAMLALAWHDARSEHLPPARRRARLAADMGVAEGPYWELWAELHALEGDCDRARVAFERALAARADAALGRVLDEPLQLGDYHLPPTYLERCGEPAPND